MRLFQRIPYECEIMILQADGGKREALTSALQHPRLLKQRALMAFTGKECRPLNDDFFETENKRIFKVLNSTEAFQHLSDAVHSSDQRPLMWLESHNLRRCMKSYTKANLMTEHRIDHDLNGYLRDWVDIRLLFNLLVENREQFHGMEMFGLFGFDNVDIANFWGDTFFFLTQGESF